MGVASEAAAAAPTGAAAAPEARPAEVTYNSKYEAELRRLFRSEDADGTNTLSKRELYRILRAVGVRAPQSELLRLWKRADGDESGTIEFAEFAEITNLTTTIRK